MEFITKNYTENKFPNQKLWDSMMEHGFNTFEVDEDLCEGGAFTALASERPKYCTNHLEFNCGLFGLKRESDSIKGFDRSDLEYLVDFETKYYGNYAKYLMSFNNGKTASLVAMKRHLPQKVEICGDGSYKDLAKVELLDSRHIFFEVDREKDEYLTAYLTLDLLRVNETLDRYGRPDRTRIYHGNALGKYVVPLRETIGLDYHFYHCDRERTTKRISVCFKVEDLHKNPKAKIGFIDLDIHNCIKQPIDCEDSDILKQLMPIVEEMESITREVEI